MFISQAFAQTAPAASRGRHRIEPVQLLPLVLMFVVLYFIMIRPQMKRQKEAQGDGRGARQGRRGRHLRRHAGPGVARWARPMSDIEVANGVELQVQRSAVVQVLPKGTIK